MKTSAETVHNAVHENGVEFVVRDHIPSSTEASMAETADAEHQQQGSAAEEQPIPLETNHSRSHVPRVATLSARAQRLLDMLSPIDYYSPIKGLLAERVSPTQRRTLTLVIYSLLASIFATFCAINMQTCTLAYSVARSIESVAPGYSNCEPLVYVGTELANYQAYLSYGEDVNLLLIGKSIFFPSVDACISTLNQVIAAGLTTASPESICVSGMRCIFELPFCGSRQLACIAGANTWPPSANPTPAPSGAGSSRTWGGQTYNPYKPPTYPCPHNLLSLELWTSGLSTGGCIGGRNQNGDFVALNRTSTAIVMRTYLARAIADSKISTVCQDIYQRGAPYQCSKMICPSFPQAAGIASGWTSLFSHALFLLSSVFISEIMALFPACANS